MNKPIYHHDKDFRVPRWAVDALRAGQRSGRFDVPPAYRNTIPTALDWLAKSVGFDLDHLGRLGDAMTAEPYRGRLDKAAVAEFAELLGAGFEILTPAESTWNGDAVGQGFDRTVLVRFTKKGS